MVLIACWSVSIARRPCSCSSNRKKGGPMKRVFAALLTTCAMLSSTPQLFAQQQPPDNTKVNARDRSPSQATADQQTNTRSDIEITRDIRRAIVNDKTLSTYAHNVKVITKHGEVTLKGPVQTA